MKLNMKKNSWVRDSKEKIAGNTEKEVEKEKTKSLNVIFNYNGYSWDAFEVLGLPAGSSREKVEEAYRASVKSVEPESRVFIETAYKAILTHWGIS